MSKKRWVSWDDELKDQEDVRRLALRDMQNDLLFAAVEIGGICNMAYWAAEGMAVRVHNTGKQLHDITIGELLELLKDQETIHANIEYERNRRINKKTIAQHLDDLHAKLAMTATEAPADEPCAWCAPDKKGSQP